MKYTVQAFADKFRTLAGDEAKNIPDNLIIEAINWAFSYLPTVPKLDKAFSKHRRRNLNSRYGTKWKLNKDFRRLTNTPLLQFFSIGEGGDPCPLHLCGLDPVEFYEKNGVPELKQPGVPCSYTIEQEDDNIYLVIDRPADCPLILDYIAYGYPQPIEDFRHQKVDSKGRPQFDKSGNPIIEETTIEISAVIETVIINTLRDVQYTEAEDLAFAGAMEDIASNKYIPEAIQMLQKTWGTLKPTIIGER